MTSNPAETVLVVDDNEANRRLVGTWLHHAGFQVAEAAGGGEALDLLGSLRPDLVVLDVNMPDLDGHEVCRRIKADPALAGVPVLHTSATSILSEDRIEALEGGADAYLVMPVPPGEFLATARALLRLRQAEQELRDANERWELAFREASIGMALMDLATLRVVRANRAFAALVGRNVEELVDLDLRAMIHPDDLPLAEARLAAKCQGETQDPVEYRWLRPDGSAVWAAFTCTIVPAPQGGSHVLVHTQDRTAQRRVEEEREAARAEAETATRAKSEFISRMSHEFRTPLNSILGFAQLLELEELTADQQASVAHILRAGRHLVDLVNEVLDIARIEAGRLELSLEPVEVGPLVSEVLGLMAPEAAPRGVRLLPPPAPGPAQWVRADRQRLLQILLNLVSNAVKYNRTDGWVSVSWHGGEAVRIEVRDSGIGIPPEAMARLFQPFQRVGSATGVEGTGLGLAISRRLAEAMGGALHADSVPGEGSHFSVELPASAPLALPDDDPAGAEGGGDTPLTLLYVEDNLSNIRLVERILANRPGVRLITAMQGRLAVDLAREHRPALVLLDLHLPDIGGEEVLGKLRAEPGQEDTPVVMLSADASPNQISRLLDAGAADYLTKPLDVRRFLSLVDGLTARRPA